MESRGAMLLSVIPFFIDIVSTVFFCTTCRWSRHFFSHFFCVLYNKYFSVSLLRSIAVQFFILSISYVYILHLQSLFMSKPWCSVGFIHRRCFRGFLAVKGEIFSYSYSIIFLCSFFFVPLVAYAQKRGGRYVIFFACFVQ